MLTLLVTLCSGLKMMLFQKRLLPLVFLVSGGRLFYRGDSNHGNSDRKQNYEAGDVYHHIFSLPFLQTFSFSLHLFQPFISLKSGEMVLNVFIAINDLVGHELNG